MKDKTPKRKKAKQNRTEKFVPNSCDEITQKALTSFIKEQLDSKTNARKDIDALSSVIEEFLKSYIVLGYTFDGKPINIIYAHNQQEADSLITIVNKFINSSIGNDNE